MLRTYVVSRHIFFRHLCQPDTKFGLIDSCLVHKSYQDKLPAAVIGAVLLVSVMVAPAYVKDEQDKSATGVAYFGNVALSHHLCLEKKYEINEECKFDNSLQGRYFGKSA